MGKASHLMKQTWALAMMLLAAKASAQEVATMAQDVTQDNDHLAKAGVYSFISPGGSFLVRLSTVSSISMHEYVVDGAATVTEMTVATTSSEVARFYCLETVKLQSPVGIGDTLIDKAKETVAEGLKRTGEADLLHKVVKNYPTTTHAHTIEYRLERKDQLNKMYSAVLHRWLFNDGPWFCKVPPP